LKSVLEGISTIIFDLGGVVLNLDPKLTALEFSKLSGIDIPKIYEIFIGNEWVGEFEKGKITPDEFRSAVREALGLKVDNNTIDLAWNAMLLELPEERLKLLANLRADFNTMVLSNTNEIHVDSFSKTVANVTRGRSIHEFFNTVYYSNELGMRKPDREIFEFVLKSNNLQPDTTLFIDDMEQNITAAAQIGIKTVHLTNQEDLFAIFG